MENTDSVYRDRRMDNIKGLLILFVVFGHLLELHLGLKMNKFIYTFIYLFHMPVFIFITGYFAQFDGKKLLKNMLYPYLLFQVLYLLYVNLFLQQKSSNTLLIPYWIMWYMLALSVWSAALYFFKDMNAKKSIYSILGAFICALLAGNCQQIGRYLSLSRIIVFFPFFLSGYIYRKYQKVFVEWIIKKEQERAIRLSKNKTKLHKADSSKIGFVIALLALLAIICFCWINCDIVNRNWLYEATSYDKSNYCYGFRILHIITAYIMLLVLYQLIPNRRICMLSKIGTSTLQIYLLHGFIIKFIDKYEFIELLKQLDTPVETIIILLIAIIITIVLSGNIIKRILNILLMKKKK